jgi:hypothetical protein
MLNIVGLFEGVEVAPDLLDAAPGRPNDAITALEVLNEEAFGRRGVDLVATVRHGLAAASLVERVTDIEPESLQKL